MAKKNPDPKASAAANVVTITVSSLQKQGRWRCGRFFPAEPITVDVTLEELAMIEQDPVLKVVRPAS